MLSTETLKELRQLRNEFDYSPYPGLDPGVPYDAKAIEATIRRSIVTSKKLVRAFRKLLDKRG